MFLLDSFLINDSGLSSVGGVICDLVVGPAKHESFVNNLLGYSFHHQIFVPKPWIFFQL